MTFLRPRRGFTLTEMLVVIGIIVLLIGILIPVVGRVRMAGYEATSRSQIQSLVTAIERYHQDHKAYPGPLNRDFAAGLDYELDGRARTSTENLTLGLLGGAVRNGASIEFNPDAVGAGPMSLNVAKPKKYAAYLEKIPAEMTNGLCDPDFIPSASDTDIPEFVDRFPDRKPILYMRARVGAPWTATEAGGFGPMDEQYDPGELSFYGVTFLDATTGVKYFNHPSMPNTPKQKDRFILISPGKDRKYGTGDDITNFD